MTRKDKSSEEVILITGQSSDELGAEIREYKRTRRSRPERCYLCRREKDSDSVAVLYGEDGPEPISVPLRIITIHRDMNGEAAAFRVCTDCALLLNVHKEHEIEEMLKPSVN